ncbi:putative olfactory receptor 52L2, partial [Protopterus annectens]|uniref:putative olfactory receptor 52L2 n=1 Tax=Protopterus annectens TaxID=7888 RepID=UPI001CFA5027
MENGSQNNSEDLSFLLTGFSGLQDVQHWLFVPFFFMFLVALFGNLTVMYIVLTEQSLHKPMYWFICFLSAVDLIACLSLMPSLLLILSSGPQAIHSSTCFLQMFCVSFIGAMESSVLLLMAYDRYIAVCKPLSYSSVVTNAFILRGSIIVTIRSFCIVLPMPVLAGQLPYCSMRIVHSIYCEYLAIINTACVRTTISDTFLYIVLAVIGVPDATFIGLSYYKIIKATLKLKSKEAQQKTFSTCSSHIFIIVSFYLSGLLTLSISIFENKMPPYMRVLFSVLYITVPPTLNPIIYSIKNKE